MTIRSKIVAVLGENRKILKVYCNGMQRSSMQYAFNDSAESVERLSILLLSPKMDHHQERFHLSEFPRRKPMTQVNSTSRQKRSSALHDLPNKGELARAEDSIIIFIILRHRETIIVKLQETPVIDDGL